MTDTSPARVDELAEAAGAAAPVTAAASGPDRIGWLTAIADDLDADVDELVALAVAETHLGADRLRGEVARTTLQLRSFAAMVADGGYLEATIDHADPASVPPRPDLRRLLVPIGPVAVFAASNFPFAFSVAGGDSASALAVGCPVVVKIHEGHPQTSRRTAQIVVAALARAGAPSGSFAVVEGRDAGARLVSHPAIRAVGFTGSLAGGRALHDLAAARPDPIPFYGELGSINPVVITRAALAARGEELARGLAASFTMGSGQFCTKPGVIFVPAGGGFAEQLALATPLTTATELLTPQIASGFAAGIAALARDPGVAVVAGSAEQTADRATPIVLTTTAEAVRARPETLLEEHFGPATLLVEYRDDADLASSLAVVPGSLTATLHAEAAEVVDSVVAQLSARAGRVLFGGWPTGVAVAWAQHHGGPWPAATSIHTSVGMSAARRFQRPITFQDAPQRLLPAELRDGAVGIPRRIDGTLTLT